MTWHIICSDHESDTYSKSPTATDLVLEVPVNQAAHPNWIRNNIRKSLSEYGLIPTDEALDFLSLALSVYNADIRVPRNTAHDNWTRDFVLHLPVSSPYKWNTVISLVEHMLSFLTGDKWRINIRESVRQRILSVNSGQVAKRVCLFSGGLDSFIGASDLLAEGKSVWLMSYYPAGVLSAVQKSIFNMVDAAHPGLAQHIRFDVQPPKKATGVTELTTRSRSILFMGLALVTASALGDDTELVVPENGLISLNVPLTLTRTSSLSTRTTHPYFLNLLQQVFNGLGIDTTITTPYRFLTKGEMLKKAKNQTLTRDGASMTMSCSHPGEGRHYPGRKPFQHCGYCVPCIIRRASMEFVGLDDPTQYAIDILSSPPSPHSAKGRDLRAFEMALNRNAANSKMTSVIEVMNSGPLPGTGDDFKEFVGVYHRGMDEVRQFLNEVRH